MPRQRHAAAAVLLSRCILAAPLRGPFPAVAPLRSPLRFVFAVYRCVRFFCSFVAAVRSTPSGEAVGGQGFALPGHRFRPPGSLGVDFPAPRSPELLRSSFLLLRTDLVALRCEKKITILNTIFCEAPPNLSARAKKNSEGAPGFAEQENPRPETRAGENGGFFQRFLKLSRAFFGTPKK